MLLVAERLLPLAEWLLPLDGCLLPLTERLLPLDESLLELDQSLLALDGWLLEVDGWLLEHNKSLLALALRFLSRTQPTLDAIKRFLALVGRILGTHPNLSFTCNGLAWKPINSKPRALLI
jgi:hypothetical protein